MTNIGILALKEIQEGIRNRWVLATTLLLAALALTLTFLGSAPTGEVGVRPLDIVIVSLSSLTIFLLPLIALLISHDAIVGEMERGTMLLLLSYPIARWQVLLGKFVGHLAILAFATLIGYGASVLALLAMGAVIETESWLSFMAMIGSSILLGAAFIALGYLASALVRARGTAAGIAIGIWLLFVLIYDMGLLALLVVDQDRTISGGLLDALSIFNPTHIHRLLSLPSSVGVSSLSGMAGVAANSSLSPGALIATLIAWAAIPLGLAVLTFSRREL